MTLTPHICDDRLIIS